MKLKSKLILMLAISYTVIVLLLFAILSHYIQGEKSANVKLYNNELLETGSELHFDASSLFFKLLAFYLSRHPQSSISQLKTFLTEIDQEMAHVLLFDTAGSSITNKPPDPLLLDLLDGGTEISRILDNFRLNGETCYEYDNFGKISTNLENIQIPVQLSLQVLPASGLVIGYGSIFHSLRVRLSFARTANAENNRVFLINGTIFFISGVLILLCATFIFMHTLVTIPLQKLAGGFALVAAGNRDLKIHFKRRDEIGLLGEAFNLMVEELEGNFHEITREIDERRQAESRLKKAVSEREILLREIHHRLKNNLSIIYSMVDLQKDIYNTTACAGFLENLQARIKSILLVHDKLYRSKDLSLINFKQYCEELIGHLSDCGTLKELQVELSLDIQEVFLHIDIVMPCGLILNELVLNSIKHAFTPGMSGIIKVIFRYEQESRAVLTVADNGRGMPAAGSGDKETLGLLLIKSLTDQLNGHYQVCGPPGMETEISFPVTPGQIQVST